MTTSSGTANYSINQQNTYWAVVGVRPSSGTDYDIGIYSSSSYSSGSLLASSAGSGSVVDFVVGDFNHSALGTYYPQVTRFSGSGSGTVEWEDGTETVPLNTAVSVSWGSSTVVKVWDVSLTAGVSYTITVSSGSADVGWALFRSNGATYFAGRGGAVLSRDVNGAGGTETGSYTAPASDWYGLVVWSNTATSASVTIRVDGQCTTLSSTPMTVGQTVSGSLTTSDCSSPVRGSGYYADRYTFSGTAGQQIAIALSSTAFDTYLYLLGPTGSVVASDDDGGGGGNSRIPPSSGYITLSSSGTYTIEATSFNAGATGSYTLSLLTPSGASIQPITTSTSYPRGTPIVVEISVGNPTNVTDLYGISFKLRSNSSSCTYVDNSAAAGEFLGTNVLPFSRKIDDQTVDISVTRLSSPGVSGSGVVARAQFTTPASLSNQTSVTFSLSDIVGTNSSGGAISFSSSTWTVTITPGGVAVWPGDCDNNGTVNAGDILPIGLYYGQERPGANNPGSEWRAYLRDEWQADGTTPRRVYADANGSGVVDAADVLVIGLNYGRTRTSNSSLGRWSTDEETQSRFQNATLKPVVISPITVGQAFSMEIRVGDPTPISNLYGISFRLRSSSTACTYVDNSVQQGSFLGSNTIPFFQKVNNQTLDIGITRTSPPGVSGTGVIARVQFIKSTAETVQLIIENVSAVDPNGTSIPLSVEPLTISGTTSVMMNNVPALFALYANYPNPFNPSTTISYDLPRESYVTLSVYNIFGQEVEKLIDEIKPAGRHTIRFDASRLAGGVYLYRLQAGSFVETKKMILLK